MFLYSLLDSVKWYPILFDTPLNAVRSVAIWLTLVLLIAYTVCLLLVKGEFRSRFLKTSAFAAVGYAGVLGVTFLILSFLEDGIEPILFYPILVLLAAIAASAVALCFKRNKLVFIVAGVATGCAAVITLICMGVHFGSGVAAEKNWLTNEDVNTVGLYIACAIVIASLILLCVFSKKGTGFDTKSISYAAICIAMSFALSYMRIVRMPQGGSITPASMLPLMLYAYMFGTRKGVFTGLIYGLLQAFQSPDILHPAQFLLDYPLAFACIGLAGLFAQTRSLQKLPQVQFSIGAIIAGLGRFIMHFLSGVFAFGAFAPKDTNVVWYSLTYQAAYVLPDLAIAIVVGILLLSSKSIVKTCRKFHTLEQN
ncbi:MAG: energy-coupled thiamine transporter ThiT [Clostridia bacterium]|nr:energy-coupled thiamine transporter ThiT [Clostridia bacterium]